MLSLAPARGIVRDALLRDRPDDRCPPIAMSPARLTAGHPAPHQRRQIEVLLAHQGEFSGEIRRAVSDVCIE